MEIVILLPMLPLLPLLPFRDDGENRGGGGGLGLRLGWGGIGGGVGGPEEGEATDDGIPRAAATGGSSSTNTHDATLCLPPEEDDPWGRG
jgi:hypothetical protein